VHASDCALWQCTTCGHQWRASIASRAGQGTGCPACARILNTTRIRQQSMAGPGQSLADLRPQLAAELVACRPSPERTAATLRPASNLLCRWRCSTCRHTWDASPASRVRGGGCPVCARERLRRARTVAPPGKGLVNTHAQLASEFIECVDEPGRLTTDLLAGSNKRCLWQCAACGHQWTTTVASRTAGTGCPACARGRTAAARAAAPPGGSLADRFPQLVAEMAENLDHPERTPMTLRPNSHDRCRWRCQICGQTWITSIKNRTRNETGCRTCAEDVPNIVEVR
jgi:rubrerythrin